MASALAKSACAVACVYPPRRDAALPSRRLVRRIALSKVDDQQVLVIRDHDQRLSVRGDRESPRQDRWRDRQPRSLGDRIIGEPYPVVAIRRSDERRRAIRGDRRRHPRHSLWTLSPNDFAERAFADPNARSPSNHER